MAVPVTITVSPVGQQTAGLPFVVRGSITPNLSALTFFDDKTSQIIPSLTTQTKSSPFSFVHPAITVTGAYTVAVFYAGTSGRSASFRVLHRVLTPTSGGSLNDAANNVWTLSTSGSVYENGAPVPGGGGTGQLTIVNNIIYATEIGKTQWWTFSTVTKLWSQTTPPIL